MSKVLVIEPHRIMQQAIAIALYPDNDVQLMRAVPESLSVGDFAAVIVDAASLKEKNGLGAKELLRVQAWKLPMIWIDGEAAGQPPKDAVVTLNKPISREALIDALNTCLGRASGSRMNDRAKPEGNPGSSQEAAKKSPAKATKFIELVDVVGEDPEAENKTQ
jgi:DNA-binding NtrC family response regulator